MIFDFIGALLWISVPEGISMLRPAGPESTSGREKIRPEAQSSPGRPVNFFENLLLNRAPANPPTGQFWLDFPAGAAAWTKN
jgi:hypothetical protein